MKETLGAERGVVPTVAHLGCSPNVILSVSPSCLVLQN